MRARDPWVLPIETEARRRAAAAKRALAEATGGASDHLALVRGTLTHNNPYSGTP